MGYHWYWYTPYRLCDYLDNKWTCNVLELPMTCTVPCRDARTRRHCWRAWPRRTESRSAWLHTQRRSQLPVIYHDTYRLSLGGFVAATLYGTIIDLFVGSLVCHSSSQIGVVTGRSLFCPICLHLKVPSLIVVNVKSCFYIVQATSILTSWLPKYVLINHICHSDGYLFMNFTFRFSTLENNCW